MCGIYAALVEEEEEEEEEEERGGSLEAAEALALEALRRGPHARRGPDAARAYAAAGVVLGASVLRMHGLVGDATQPAVGAACVLAWNGEWYDSGFGCDTPRALAVVDRAVAGCATALGAVEAVARALAGEVRGEYAFAAWVPSLGLLVYGRDPLGRRSLLRRAAPLLVVSSVATDVGDNNNNNNNNNSNNNTIIWDEVPTTGVFGATAASQVLHAPWPRGLLLDGIGWPPVLAAAAAAAAAAAPSRRLRRRDDGRTDGEARRDAARLVLDTLSAAVASRVRGHPAGVAVLFSGGIDSVMLAALAHDHVPRDAPIELINVAFGASGRADAEAAPDRIAARVALAELARQRPRDWRLVEVSVDAAALAAAARRIVHLAKPNMTHMDFNIAAALYFGARGTGALYSPPRRGPPESLESSSVSTSTPPRAAAAAAKEVEEDATTTLLRYANGAPHPSSQRDAPRRPKKEEVVCRDCVKTAHRKCSFDRCARCCRRAQRAAPASGDCTTHPLVRHPKKNNNNNKGPSRATPPDEATVEASDDPSARGAVEEKEKQQVADPVVEWTTASARVLLLGMGADELLAGYSRHRTAWQRGGAAELERELDKDVGRIGCRNLGRDDRVVADAGREARYPFLDERFVQVCRVDATLGDLVDLDAAPGSGDKRALRDAARLIGLDRVATLQKRAIQFGTRVAPHSNRLVFGSNRKGDGAAPFDLSRLHVVVAKDHNDCAPPPPSGDNEEAAERGAG